MTPGSGHNYLRVKDEELIQVIGAGSTESTKILEDILAALNVVVAKKPEVSSTEEGGNALKEILAQSVKNGQEMNKTLTLILEELRREPARPGTDVYSVNKVLNAKLEAVLEALGSVFGRAMPVTPNNIEKLSLIHI